jgi:hypothetical protein
MRKGGFAALSRYGGATTDSADFTDQGQTKVELTLPRKHRPNARFRRHPFAISFTFSDKRLCVSARTEDAPGVFGSFLHVFQPEIWMLRS